MKLWIDSELKEDFSDLILNDLIYFYNQHKKVIIENGVYLKKDNYIICFCADKKKEPQIFLVSTRGEINKKETFKELIENTSPLPCEYTWKELREEIYSD